MKLEQELWSLWELVVLQFKQIFPYWIAGVMVGSLLSVYVAGRLNTLVTKVKQDKYHFWASLIAAVLGVASPICMYGTVPLIASFGRIGVPAYILATFMISSIMLNPNLLFVSLALGLPVALLRLLSSLAAGVTAGILVKTFFKGKALFNFSGFDNLPGIPNLSIKKSLLKDIHRSITITAPYFLLGIVLTALFDRYVLDKYVIMLFGPNRGLGVLLAASMGVPVYLCGGGTVPLLKAWLQAGMSVGSAVAFMISGPATKLTNLSAVKVILGGRNFMYYLVFSLLFAVLAGLLTDIIYYKIL